jgi:hypothetical protein
MTHTANLSVTAIEEAFGEWLLTHGLWPRRFLVLNLSDYCLSGHRKIALI